MALEQHLKNQAVSTNQSLDRLRRYAAFEAFLSRLFDIQPTAWALKGALALEYRLQLTGRTTTDIDLQRLNTPDELLDDLILATRLKKPDYFSFTAPNEETPNPNKHTRRFKLKAQVAEREFTRIQLDIGTKPIPNQPSQQIFIPSLLDFVQSTPVKINIATTAFHIAEKLHAYLKPRPTENTRTKDFIDLQLLRRTNSPGTKDLAAAISLVFSHQTLPVPQTLPPPPKTWEETYKRLAREQHINTNLEEAFQEIKEWVTPALEILRAH